MSVHPDTAGCAVDVGRGEERLGRYLLRRLIGKGAMGEVWRGEDPEIGRDVAIKVLRVPEGLTERKSGEWRSRFLREARAAGRLSHPGIVAIHDVGEADDGRLFIVMELVVGRGLDEILREDSLPPRERSLEWIAQLAEALDSAHRRGIVHRDVKPANILIDEEGRARLVDFGIARLSESELTREGSFLGSPAFASPEQIRGHAVDGRSDLFSLGAILYTLLAGTRPFRGEELSALAYEICHVEPLPPSHFAPQIPRELGAIAMKALAKKPDERYASGRDLVADLRAVAAGERPVHASASPLMERTVGPDGAPASRSVTEGQGNGPEPRADAELGRHAAAAGSAAAVAMTRGALLAGAVTKWMARTGADWSRTAALHTGPVLRRAGGAVAGAAARLYGKGRALWARGWSAGPRARAALIAAALLVLGGAATGGYFLLKAEREEPAIPRWFKKLKKLSKEESAAPKQASAGFFDRVQGASVDSPAHVTIRVTHGLGDGEITVWSGKRRVLSEDLEADERSFNAFGREVLTYKRERVEWRVRIPSGDQDLRVRVQSGDKDLDIIRELSESPRPGRHYILEVDVGTWPSADLELNWEED